jgi:hypothetical protein
MKNDICFHKVFLAVGYTLVPSNNPIKNNRMGLSPVTYEAIYALAKICHHQIYLSTKSGLHSPYEAWLHLVENNSSCTPWPYDAHHKTTLVTQVVVPIYGHFKVIWSISFL